MSGSELKLVGTGEIIDVDNTIVIIGPNGVGKTRFGANLARINQSEWISAMRNLELGRDIQLLTEENAKNQFTQHVIDSRNNPWRMSTDLQFLLSKLKIDDSNSAVRFRDSYCKTNSNVPEETSLQKLIKFWNAMYPTRMIDFTTYAPKINNMRTNTPQEYEIRMMSDGERTALYLAARVIDTNYKIIIVDEPEVHFHSLLAKKFWTELEQMRNDCRFVYITHDLPFALSRDRAKYIILNSESDYQIIEGVSSFPSDLIENILGAASFSFSSNKALFCEGNDEKSKDYLFFSAYYNSTKIPVIPVGGCDNVKRCVDVFNNNASLKNMKAYGIIDTDFWPAKYFSNLAPEITKLNMHEIENLFCADEVFAIVARFLLISEHKIKEYYNEAIENAKNSVKDIVLNKYILERIRKHSETSFLTGLNSIRPNVSLVSIKKSFQDNLQSTVGEINYDKLFENEENTLKELLKNNEVFIKEYPGKGIISYLAQKLGITVERYIEIIVNLIKMTMEDEKGSEYRERLKSYFKKYLPEIET